MQKTLNDQFKSLSPKLYYVKTKDGKTYSSYFFENKPAEPIALDTTEKCRDLSLYVGAFTTTRLEKLKKRWEIKEAAPELISKIQGTINWVNKKVDTHVREVVDTTQNILDSDFFTVAAKSAEWENESELKDILLRSAWLHDIGRVGEVGVGSYHEDTAGSGVKYNSQDIVARAPITLAAINSMQTSNEFLQPYTGQDHAFVSADILETCGEKNPYLLLSVRYHGVRDLTKSLNEDKLFNSLPEKDKRKAVFACGITRDADKIANMLSYTQTGLKKCGEMQNPKFCGNCEVDYSAISDLYQGKTVDQKNISRYMSALCKFVSWTFDLNLPDNKKFALKTIINPLFAQMRAEAADEFTGKQFGVTPAVKQSEEKYTGMLNVLDGLQTHVTCLLNGEKSPIAFNDLIKNAKGAIINPPNIAAINNLGR